MTNSKLNDYIKIYPNVFSLSFCEWMITHVDQINKWEDACTLNNEANIDSQVIENEYAKTVINESLFKCFLEYEAQFPYFKINDLDKSICQKYKSGSSYFFHTDENLNTSRSATSIILLNQNFKGGELKFFKNYICPISIGSVVIFPSNFLFPHKIERVLDGTRYSIVTFSW